MESVMGWLVFLWTVFSQPELMGGQSEAPWLIGSVLFVVAVTWAFMAIAGKRIGRRSWALAALAGGMFLPTVIIALAYAWIAFAPAEDGHGGAMAAGMVLVIGVWSAPFSFATSVLYTLVSKRRAKPA